MPSETAGVGQEDAGIGFGDGWWEISQIVVEFACPVEASELEFDYAGTVGERAGVLKVPRGLGGIVRNEEPGEEGVAPAKTGVVVGNDPLPVGQRLVTCSTPVPAKELALGLPDAVKPG